MKSLTFAQAVELYKRADELEYLPTPTINAAGMAALAQFVADNAKTPERHDIDAWGSHAESEATNMLAGQTGIIEMRGFDTSTRNPVTLTLLQEWFDWAVYE